MEVSSAFGLAPYDRLDPEVYAAKTFLGDRTFNHHSSVGCPYVCNFCAVTSVARGRWLADPAEDVVEAVRLLHGRFGADAIEFHDNNFFAAEGRVRQVAEGIAPLGLRWWGEGRIDTMLRWTDATWHAMANSGLKMVFFGAESGDQEALDAMDKGGLQVGDTLSLNRRARSFGVIPEFSFVLGNPADPEGDIERSIGLIERLKADNPAAEIILYLYTPVPLPGQLDHDQAQGLTPPIWTPCWRRGGSATRTAGTRGPPGSTRPSSGGCATSRRSFTRAGRASRTATCVDGSAGSSRPSRRLGWRPAAIDGRWCFKGCSACGTIAGPRRWASDRHDCPPPEQTRRRSEAEPACRPDLCGRAAERDRAGPRRAADQAAAHHPPRRDGRRGRPPFEALWPRRAALTACICVAVTDGRYGGGPPRRAAGPPARP